MLLAAMTCNPILQLNPTYTLDYAEKIDMAQQQTAGSEAEFMLSPCLPVAGSRRLLPLLEQIPDGLLRDMAPDWTFLIAAQELSL